MSNANPVTLSNVREREFPIVQEYTYLNTAAMAPLPNRTVAAIAQTAQIKQYPGTERYRAVPAPEEAARAKLARLINASPDDIIFTSNTSHGMNIAAMGIDWRAGDNVVVPQSEFPSLAHIWNHLRQIDVEVRWVAWSGVGPSVDQIMERVDGRTRAVSCSAIKWDTGYFIDLESLGRRCAERNVLFIVDGIQVIGAQPVDVKAARISALSTHGYKWLMAGHGIGALYVAPEAIDRIRPRYVGYTGFAGDGMSFNADAEFKPGAARYGMGGGNRLGQAALLASLTLIEEIGVNTISEHNAALSEALADGLSRKGVRIVSPTEPERRTAITVFTLGSREQDAAFVDALEQKRISVSLRPLGVRISPNFYNTEAEIKVLLDAMPG
ncbi:MAG: aminotransferase class V-fold PLP-dependent enzyme [Chloroflexi bacterium]|nr:aminotransferase class V-fold PLP-dependent enzyme [Chloroflexota bacterium]